MSATSAYLRQRRRNLNTQHRCQRCGDPVSLGHVHCEICLTIKAIKAKYSRGVANPVYQLPLF